MTDQDIEATIADRMSEINDRITESEREMTKWKTYMEARIHAALDLLEEEPRSAAAVEKLRAETVNHIKLIEDGPITSMTTALGELQAAVAHTEHSEDRRRLNAKQNAKGDWQLDATVELFGSDNHIVAQELARLVDEGRREMRAEVEEPAAV